MDRSGLKSPWKKKRKVRICVLIILSDTHQYATTCLWNIFNLPASSLSHLQNLKKGHKYGKYGFTPSFFASVFYQIVLAMSRKMMTVCA